MPNMIEQFTKSLKTSQLVDVHNGICIKPVKKFVDRATAEARVIAAITENVDNKAGASREDILKLLQRSEVRLILQPEQVAIQTAKPAPVVELKKAVDKAIASGSPVLVNKPAIEVLTDKASDKALKAVESEGNKKPIAKKSAAPSEDGPRKQNTPPHLNVRCAHCGYYAKTTPAMMKIARLKCPVDGKHGNLLTAEERNEKRGR